MTASGLPKGTLGRLVEEYPGSNPTTWQPQSSPEHLLIIQGYQTWIRCKHLMRKDPFKDRMSLIQINTFRLLDDWWDNQIIKRYENFLNDLTIPFVISWELADWGKLLSMPFCWLYEFVPSPNRSDAHDMVLDLIRQSAGQGYAAQRVISSMTYEATVTTVLPKVFGLKPKSSLSAVLGATPDPCPWLDLRESIQKPPRYLWNVKKSCIVVTATLSTSPKYIAISHTWGRWRKPGKGVKVGDVPWLVPENERWEVEALPDLFQKIPFDVEYVWIDLLCIPQDSAEACFPAIRRQEIARQASIFAGAEIAIAWNYDIPCWEPLREAIRFLSFTWLKVNRDKKAVAFLLRETNINLDGSISEARKAADTASGLFRAKRESDEQPSHDKFQRVAHWFQSLWALQESLLRPDMILCDESFNVLAASPDFYITCDMCVALMTVTSPYAPKQTSSGQVSESSTISAQLERRINQLDVDNATEARRLAGIDSWLSSIPQAAADLFQLGRVMSWWLESHESPMSLLNQGVRRHCSGKPVEAIMAVFGATEWYSYEGSPEDNELVLGMYPLAFLREIHKKFGGDIFMPSLWIKSQACGWPAFPGLAAEVHLHDPKAYQNSKIIIPRGSMLPFTVANLWTKDGIPSELSALDICSTVNPQIGWSVYQNSLWTIKRSHTTVASWEICASGSVLLPYVAFEKFSVEKEHAQSEHCISPDKGDWSIYNVYLWPCSDGHQCADLAGFLGALDFGGVKHAVCVSESFYAHGRFCAGIILGSLDQTHHVKLGYYHGCRDIRQKGECHPCPATRVDWIVL